MHASLFVNNIIKGTVNVIASDFPFKEEFPPIQNSCPLNL